MRHKEGAFLPRSIDDGPLRASADDCFDDTGEDGEREVLGFLTSVPDASDVEFTFAGNDDDYPEDWLEVRADGSRRLKPNFRKHQSA